ncbi:MAG: FAD-binding protein, partial [Planctomycetota bacterium]
SVDGDTAQVPAQMAEELDIPCIPYATDVELNNGQFTFTRIITGGCQIVEPLHKPAVITVAKYEHQLFASFARTRKSNQTTLIQWGPDDVKATAMGVKGSKTRVIRVFPPGKTTRKCQHVESVEELANIILDMKGKKDQADASHTRKETGYVLPQKRQDAFDRHYEGTSKEVEDYKILAAKLKELNLSDLDAIREDAKESILADEAISFHKKALDDMLEGLKLTTPEYHGDVWVMAEHAEGELSAATFELLGKARELADSLEVHVGVVLVGHAIRSMTDALIGAGTDKVYVIEDPLLKNFDPHSYRKAVSDVYMKYQPQIILYGATPQGRVLAPMVSYRVGCGLTADCTGLDIRDSSRRGQIAVLMQTRPALGGNVMATICTKDSSCQMATARPGVMKRLNFDPTRTGQVIDHPVEFATSDLSVKILRTEKAHGQVNFDSDAIVSGGRGLQNREGYHQMVTKLCGALSEKLGISVEQGASRTAVEQGYTERIHQVGQTGTAVGPDLYIAIGISGAIQHMIGVANSKTIVAINLDHHAPIFKQCDYYLIGNAEQIVPELVEAIKAG